MIINTEGDFIAPWHLAPKELVKEQGAREQWIYLTSTQFSYLKMLAPKFTVITSLIDIDMWKCTVRVTDIGPTSRPNISG